MFAVGWLEVEVHNRDEAIWIRGKQFTQPRLLLFHPLDGGRIPTDQPLLVPLSRRSDDRAGNEFGRAV
jgi:hypothetical protein